MKPILFNTEMVRAILDGRKTVTRRCVKTQSKKASGFYVTFRKSDNAFTGVYDYDENEMMFDSPQIPPYQYGDILYVQETGHLVPREAARIFLQVTDVRVERLQDMSQEDAEKEGRTEKQDPKTKFTQSPLLVFMDLWNSTIKPADRARYGWEANPWVWVIEFERCGRPD